jgi:DNA-nicking Smr family endonuclease
VGKQRKPFNNPFSDLKLPEALPSQQSEEEPAPPIEDEADLFRAAVGEVRPVRGSPRLPPLRPLPSAQALRDLDPDAEAFAELCELVAQQGPLDLKDSDEHIEGAAPGLDARILRSLRAGHYSIQAHLDLHGLTREEAKEELVRFVEDAHRRGLRTVLIVHGRGLHSKDQIPVLKSGLQVWLSRGRVGRHVLAFTSAQRCDGGAGAVYVLLRR